MQNCPKCGTKTKFVEFNTFSYYYCNKCKVEVGEPKREETERQLAFPSFKDTIWFDTWDDTEGAD